MRLAYIILAHAYPELLVRLVKRLYTPEDTFFIHIDRKTPRTTYAYVTQELRSCPNVRFLARTICTWGSFSQVRATFDGIRAVVEGGEDYEYVILLTGQDYPLRSTRQIHDTLSRAGGRSFLDWFSIPHAGWDTERGGLSRFEQWHIFVRGRRVKFPRRPGLLHSDKLAGRLFLAAWRATTSLIPVRSFPPGLIPYGGSAFWCLSRCCLNRVWEFVNRRSDVVRFFKYVFIPDEMIFQTILLNSPCREHIVNNNLRHIVWPPHSPHPVTFRAEHFGELVTSRALFARKFDPLVDATILDMLDAASVSDQFSDDLRGERPENTGISEVIAQ